MGFLSKLMGKKSYKPHTQLDTEQRIRVCLDAARRTDLDLPSVTPKSLKKFFSAEFPRVKAKDIAAFVEDCEEEHERRPGLVVASSWLKVAVDDSVTYPHARELEDRNIAAREVVLIFLTMFVKADDLNVAVRRLAGGLRESKAMWKLLRTTGAVKTFSIKEHKKTEAMTCLEEWIGVEGADVKLTPAQSYVLALEVFVASLMKSFTAHMFEVENIYEILWDCCRALSKKKSDKLNAGEFRARVKEEKLLKNKDLLGDVLDTAGFRVEFDANGEIPTVTYPDKIWRLAQDIQRERVKTRVQRKAQSEEEKVARMVEWHVLTFLHNLTYLPMHLVDSAKQALEGEMEKETFVAGMEPALKSLFLSTSPEELRSLWSMREWVPSESPDVRAHITVQLLGRQALLKLRELVLSKVEELPKWEHRQRVWPEPDIPLLLSLLHVDDARVRQVESEVLFQDPTFPTNLATGFTPRTVVPPVAKLEDVNSLLVGLSTKLLHADEGLFSPRVTRQESRAKTSSGLAAAPGTGLATVKEGEESKQQDNGEASKRQVKEPPKNVKQDSGLDKRYREALTKPRDYHLESKLSLKFDEQKNEVIRNDAVEEEGTPEGNDLVHVPHHSSSPKHPHKKQSLSERQHKDRKPPTWQSQSERSPRHAEISPKRPGRSPKRSDKSPKHSSRSPKRTSKSPKRTSKSPKRSERSPKYADQSPKELDTKGSLNPDSARKRRKHTVGQGDAGGDFDLGRPAFDAIEAQDYDALDRYLSQPPLKHLKKRSPKKLTPDEVDMRVLVTNSDSRSLLHMAARSDVNVQAAKLLMRTGMCQWLVQDKYGMTPLHICARKNTFLVAEVLLAAKDEDGKAQRHFWVNGCKWVNSKEPRQSKTPLMLAAEHGSKEMVSLLLGHKADTTHRDTKGRTARDHAAANGHDDLVLLLTQSESRSSSFARAFSRIK